MRPVRCWGVHISVVLRVEGACYLDLREASIKALRLSIKSKWNWFRKKILMRKLTHLNFWALRYLMERVIMCRRTKRDFKLAEWEEIDSNRCEGHTHVRRSLKREMDHTASCPAELMGSRSNEALTDEIKYGIKVWEGTMDTLEGQFQGLPLDCNCEGYRDVTPIHTVWITETQVPHGCPWSTAWSKTW